MKQKEIMAYIADNQEKTAKQIAVELGLPAYRVHYVASEYGIKPRREDKRKEFTDFMRDNSHMTAKEIADEFGLKPEYVRSAAHYYMININKKVYNKNK